MMIQNIIAQDKRWSSSALFMTLLRVKIHNDYVTLSISYQISFPTGSPTSTSCVLST